MKKVYWRSSRISRIELSLIALLAIGGLAAVEAFPSVQKQPHYKEKLEAARLALVAMREVAAERAQRNIPIDRESDPMGSGLIGELITPIVTNTGHLPAKQTSINPNFAALVVHYLLRAGVQEGDMVAVALSGSFPAINIAVYAALEALRVQPIVISSTSASQWGATHPDFTWLDMEAHLLQKRIFSTRSVAASRGGIDDRALGLTRDGKLLLDVALERSDLPIIRPKSYEESVTQRVAIYNEQAGEASIAAYINVGGGTSSVGTRVGKRMFDPGLNTRPPPGRHELDSVMLHFADQGIPVVHMVRIVDQADRYGFPLMPTVMPAVGQGRIFVRVQYNIWIVVSVLALLFGALFAFIRLHLGLTLRGAWYHGKGSPRPEQMV